VKQVLFHPSARFELAESIAYYEQQSAGLGLDLLAEVEKATAIIQRTPHAWPRYKDTDFRTFLVKRFPYVIFYLDDPDAVWIAAVAHGRRRPDYWIGRTRE